MSNMALRARYLPISLGAHDFCTRCNPYTSQYRTSLWESLYLPEKQVGHIVRRVDTLHTCITG